MRPIEGIVRNSDSIVDSYQAFLRHLRDLHGLDLWNDEEQIAKWGRCPTKEVEAKMLKEQEGADCERLQRG